MKKLTVLPMMTLLISYGLYGSEVNVYGDMEYRKIFNQEKILAKHPGVLKDEGLSVPVVKQEAVKDQRGCFKRFLNVASCGCLCKPPKIKTDDDEGENVALAVESPATEVVAMRPSFSITRDALAMQEIKRSLEESDEIFFALDPYEKDSKDKERLNQTLVEDFKKKKHQSKKSSLYRPGFSMLVDTAVFGGALQLISSATGVGITTVFLANSLAQHLKSFSHAFYEIYISPWGDHMHELEELYAKKKRYLPETLQQMVEDKFAAARKSSELMADTLKFAQIALNIPFEGKALKVPSKESVEKLFDGYSPSIDDKILPELVYHCSRKSEKVTPLQSPKTVLYFQGPSGLGKTHVAHEVARLIDAPLISLTATDDPTQILGTSDSPGALLDAIAKPGMVRNAVILIDEADRFLNKKNGSLQHFLPLLDPAAQYFYSPYLRANVDISHYCFILVGNSQLKDEALKTRMTVVPFKEMAKKLKKKVILDMVEKMVAENKTLRGIEKNNALMQRIDAAISQDQTVGVRELQLLVKKIIADYLAKDKTTAFVTQSIGSEEKKQQEIVITISNNS